MLVNGVPLNGTDEEFCKEHNCDMVYYARRTRDPFTLLWIEVAGRMPSFFFDSMRVEVDREEYRVLSREKVA
jgi:hypothetical protein